MGRTPATMKVTVQANSSVQSVEGPNLTAATIAEMRNIDVSNVVIMVNGNKAEMNTPLSDGDFVHFSRNKVTSGS